MSARILSTLSSWSWNWRRSSRSPSPTSKRRRSRRSAKRLTISSGSWPRNDAATVIDAKTARRLDRFAQFGQVAAISAMKDSGLDLSKEDPFRCGVIIGSGIGGLMEFEEQHGRYYKGGPSRISPFVIPKMIANGASGK